MGRIWRLKSMPDALEGSVARVDEASTPRISTASQGRARRDVQVLMAEPWKLRQDNGAGDAHCNKVSSQRKDRDEADQRGLDCGATSSVACRSLRNPRNSSASATRNSGALKTCVILVCASWW